jgi:DNA-binding CsgD family transcriptional regulator
MCGYGRPGSLRLMLLERGVELEAMAGLLAGVDTSGGKVVLIRGEAGIGKSALVRSFLGSHADEAHVLYGSCDDLLTPQPMGPLWDISRAEPSLAEPLQNGDRRAAMMALLDLLSRGLRSTILVIEDTHWADEATLDAVKYLGRRIARTNGLLVLTYRDGEVDYDHPLRQVIGELPSENVVRMHLEGLSAPAIAGLVGDADLDVDEILVLTGGNPLFVTEVVASGVESVPSSVQDAVLARAVKLSPGGRRLLDLVCVMPGESERPLIDSVLGPTEAHMTECVRQGLLLEDNNLVSFRHELTRRSIESALNPQNRRRINQQVLDDLRGDGADPSRLVHHAREAGDVGAIIEFAPVAARAAMVIESHREAAAHFRLLDSYLERIAETERAAIVDDWARTEYYLIGSESIELLSRAIDLHRSTGDDLSLARALTFAVRVNEISGRPELAEVASREAIAILESYPSSADLASAMAQRAWLMKMRGEGAPAIEVADQAIELAEATGDELSMIYALDTKGVLMYRLGDSEGLRLVDEARRRAEQAGYPFEETLSLLNMAEAVAEHREVERAIDFSQRARDTAARYEIQIHENAAKAHHAKALEWKGQWSTAEDTATEAIGHILFYGQVVAGQVLGPLQARQGRLAARATIYNTWSRSEAGNEMQSLLPSAAALAEYLWLMDEDDPELTARFREMLSDTRRFAFPWSAGCLAFWLWMLEDLTEAPEGIAQPYRLVMEGKSIEAAEIWEKKGIPYERALALMHGSFEARLEALEVFETLGATAVAAKHRRALRDDGVAIPRGKGRETRRHTAGLTARQAEVLQLLDDGLTNTDIADRLFLSPRTVESHVSAVLTKLDSSTRKEAVARGRVEGLLAVNGDPTLP